MILSDVKLNKDVFCGSPYIYIYQVLFIAFYTVTANGRLVTHILAIFSIFVR